jgi:hypothetical protein
MSSTACTLPSSVFYNAPAYFTSTVIYARKISIKWIPGLLSFSNYKQDIQNLFSASLIWSCNKLDRLTTEIFSSDV